jgi:NAD(P)-dependent dehydrogenase (short-subunit alcohol dehydrogenase family)
VSRVALITGASGGIGQALCETFAAAGYRVVGLDRAVWTPTSPSVTPVVLDLQVFTSPSPARDAAVQALREAIGSAGLHALVNNAAVQRLGATGEIVEADVAETFAVNVVAPLMLVQLLLPELERASGSVVNISSVHATATKPGFVAYATSKAALSGMTRALAVDLGGRVRVNSISPGAIATPMLEAGFAGQPDARKQLEAVHPRGRIGIPAEVAQLCVFLASDAAANITGAEVAADGGVAVRLHDPA